MIDTRPRNAVGEPLICADCGHTSIVPLAEIGLRWKTSIDRLGMRSLIGEGECIPHGYGIAYYEADRDRAVIMPVPFNLIVGAWRSLWWHIVCPPWRFTEWKAAKSKEWRQQMYDAGYAAGALDAGKTVMADGSRRMEMEANYRMGISWLRDISASAAFHQRKEKP